MLSANRDSFTSSFPICMSFIHFSYLMALAILCWIEVLRVIVPDLRRKTFSILLLRMMLAVALSLVQFSSVAQSCPTLWDPMSHSTPGLPVHHQLPEFTQNYIHWVSDAIQPSHPLLSPSPAPNPSQHQGLFQWVNSSHEVAKVLEFQL